MTLPEAFLQGRVGQLRHDIVLYVIHHMSSLSGLLPENVIPTGATRNNYEPLCSVSGKEDDGRDASPSRASLRIGFGGVRRTGQELKSIF